MPIHIHNGDTAIITFTGVGYDKRIMGETMQLTADQGEMSGIPGENMTYLNYVHVHLSGTNCASLTSVRGYKTDNLCPCMSLSNSQQSQSCTI